VILVENASELQERLAEREVLLAEAVLSDNSHKAKFNVRIDPKIRLWSSQFLATGKIRS